MKRRFNFKMLAVLVSLVLVMGAVVDGTLAYLVTKSDTVTNTFDPAHVGCEVSDPEVNTNKKEYQYTLSPDAATNTTVYIRAAVVANWVKDGGVYWQNPTVTVSGTNWNRIDNYYYYQPEVSPKGKTEHLKIEVSGTNPGGYELQIKVLGEAIQSKPGNDVVTWDNDGMNLGG